MTVRLVFPLLCIAVLAGVAGCQQAAPLSAAVQVALRATVEDVGGAGDLAYIRGTYTMTFTPPGARVPVPDAGKFLEVRRRKADGAWLNVADIFNSDKPAPH